MDIVEGPGLDKDLLMQYKPWLAAFELSILAIMEAGYSPDLGVEEYLMEKAEEEGLETLGLETMAMQFAPFDKLSEESLTEIYESWIEGKSEAYAEEREDLIEKADTESLRNFQVAFYDERDQQMTDRIEELLHDQTAQFRQGELHA